MNYQRTQNKTTLATVFCLLMMLTALDGIGLLFFCAAAAVYAVLYHHLTKPWRVVWLVFGVGLAYLTKCVFTMTFTNPAYVAYAALLLPLCLPLVLCSGKQVKRTTLILIMAFAFAATLLGYVLAELYWHLGRDAMSIVWQTVNAYKEEVVELLLALNTNGVALYTEETAWLLLDSVIVLLPSVLGVFALAFAYLASAILLPIADRTQTGKALPSAPYEITMSKASAVIFLITFVFTVCLDLSAGSLFAAVLQNVCTLLTVGFCYIEIRRLVFRIRNHQMDYFSWMWLLLVVLSAGYALQYLALFGALHVFMKKTA